MHRSAGWQMVYRLCDWTGMPVHLMQNVLAFGLKHKDVVWKISLRYE